MSLSDTIEMPHPLTDVRGSGSPDEMLSGNAQGEKERHSLELGGIVEVPDEVGGVGGGGGGEELLALGGGGGLPGGVPPPDGGSVVAAAGSTGGGGPAKKPSSAPLQP